MTSQQPAAPWTAPPVSPAERGHAYAIRVHDLRKNFGEVEAVKGASFHVERGEIFGLLGPNGAGKTTIIQILTTLLRPTSGTAEVAGFDVVTHPAEVRQRIGLVFQEPSLDLHLTAEENLRFHARLYRMSPDWASSRIQHMLRLVELHQRQHDLVQEFSGGMRRRLEIARAFLHQPAVLFLDEPTTGLDPHTRARVWEYVRQLRDEEGTTVLMTTHYMDEAENCDRVAIMDEGRIITCDRPAALKAQLGTEILTLRSPDPAHLAAELARRYQLAVQEVADGVVVKLEAEAQSLLTGILTDLGHLILGMELRPPTLEDVFLKLTGRHLRAGEI